MKCNVNIYFNRQCIIQNVIPQYAKIKIPHTSPASKVTQKRIQAMRINIHDGVVS
jgi:hypothetical protein